jgi:hypothetical protein
MSITLSKSLQKTAWHIAEMIMEFRMKGNYRFPENISFYKKALFNGEQRKVQIPTEVVQWLEDNFYVLPDFSRQLVNDTEKTLSTLKTEKTLSTLKTAINHRRRISERRKIDPNFKMLGILRSRIYGALKGTRKLAKTEVLLGCTIQEFRMHIQSKFKTGMNWENHGQWHVDHIRPCRSFDLSIESEQRKCFHFSNLQPLWASENLRKQGKWDQ